MDGIGEAEKGYTGYGGIEIDNTNAFASLGVDYHVVECGVAVGDAPGDVGEVAFPNRIKSRPSNGNQIR